MNTGGLDVARIKQNISGYWQAEGWNWPVMVISAQRATAWGAAGGPGRTDEDARKSSKSGLRIGNTRDGLVTC
jgi:hypothetical protein